MLFVEKYYIYILIIVYIKTVVVASCPLPKKSRGSPVVRRILTVQNLNLRCDYYYSTLN